jgi:hypothetical protein
MRFAGSPISPGFAVTAILTFALGIGATTAIFSAAYALLLRFLPFQHADRIIGVYETHPQIVGGAEVNFLDYQDWRRQQTSFEQLAAYSVAGSDAGSDTMSLVTAGGIRAYGGSGSLVDPID